MQTMLECLRTLVRPRLLIRAARFGLADYRREGDLKRILKVQSLPQSARALQMLLTEEAQLEHERVEGDANYSVAHHVEVLIALIAEAQLQAASQDRQILAAE